MSLDLLFVVSLLTKMIVVAAFVVTASVVAERAGALIGALVSTLPLSAGPAYVFLALDHDTAFIADGAVASLAVNAATGVFALIYAALAQRFALFVSLPVALGLWFVFAGVIVAIHWTLPAALVLNALVFAAAIPLARRFLHARMPLVVRRWFDVPLRAVMVACLVATVVALSARVGSVVSGILAVFPIVLSSLMLILQARIGGVATACVIANGMWGLVGFSGALLTLHLAVVPLGAPVALMLALAVSIGWNVAIWFVRWRAHAGVTS
jgi:hypothetical protein